MSPVIVRDTKDAEVVEFPPIGGLASAGGVETLFVIGGPGRPLHLFRHRLSPGDSLQFDGPAFDHGFYVLDGSVDAEGETIPAGGFVVAEHGSCGAIGAGDGGACLLHYLRPEGYGKTPAGKGGRIHGVGPAGLLQTDQRDYGHRGVLLADADCPGCGVWMHKSVFAGPCENASRLHHHTADEIIYVLEGEMLVGKRHLGPGTALAINEDVRYQFGVVGEELTYLNFRPCDSHIVQAGAEDRPIHEVDLWRDSAIA